MSRIGRVNRATYWAMVALAIAISIALTLAMGRPFAGAHILLLIICLPRLHDLARSGWWALGALGLELLAGIAIAKFLPPTDFAPALYTISGVVVLAMALLGALRGNGDANAYGPAPAAGLSYSSPPKRA